jgi:photosynthetic reaction center cytochrome c subunit
LNDNVARVLSGTALPTGNTADVKQTEDVYAMMVHTSQALGVNCTHCHNSRSFKEWPQSSPQRVVAWHAIRMARAAA